jgi:hypothetical protein
MTTFRSFSCAFLAGTFLALAAQDALGHPSSGIVVDAEGQVYFQDATGQAIWTIDREGKLSKYFDRMGGHWMALDAEGSFARARLAISSALPRTARSRRWSWPTAVAPSW